jgi:hypothetical protein
VRESWPLGTGVIITAVVVAVLKILPDKPVGPCGPVGPYEPVGPSMPSRFTLYIFAPPYVPLIFVIPVMVMMPVFVS